MKNEDIINQLQGRLPVLSPYFSNQYSITSIYSAGSTATVTTSADHGLTTGDYVVINGVVTPTVVGTYTEVATEIEFNTLTDHDLTLNTGVIQDKSQKVLITGSGGYSHSFRLKSVANRKKFVVYRDGEASLPAETFSLQESSLQGFNGSFIVTSTPSTTTFTYETYFTLPDPTIYVNAIAATAARVSGAITVETAMQSYTSQGVTDLWLFVVLNDNQANKDRMNLNDAFSTQGRQMDFRQKMISGFSLYVFVPNKGDILTKTNGRAARDIIEDIRVPLFQSVLGIDFDSGLCAGGQNATTYAGDGFLDYNDAFYVHEFNFQQVVEITSGDTAINGFSRAFRDVDVKIKNQFSDSTEYTAGVDLDDEPI